MFDPHAPAPDIDPVLDPARLREIAELDLFAPEVSDLLNDLAQQASDELDMPLGMVNIVLDEAQFIAANAGVGGWIGEAQGTPVEWAFCRFAVREQADFVVEDAHEHLLVKDNPLVTVDGLRCYAGIPLVTSRGFSIGSFCVAGTEPHEFTDDEMAYLRSLATQAMERIEARRKPIEELTFA
jgi:GAF domain-containing protein